jgi:hypothetical protein
MKYKRCHGHCQHPHPGRASRLFWNVGRNEILDIAAARALKIGGILLYWMQTG